MAAPRTRFPLPLAVTLLLGALGTALPLAAAGAATEWQLEVGPAGNAVWTKIVQAGLGPARIAPPELRLLTDTHAAWQREWRELEARLLSLGTLPAELAIQSHAALREELARRGAPTRFAPDRDWSPALWLQASAIPDGPDAQPLGRAAIQSGRARTTPTSWAGVRFWAEGAGYAVGRRSAGYGLEGGAALPLDERVNLTAGLRMAGYALGSRLEPELTDVEDRVVTPFLGLDFRF